MSECPKCGAEYDKDEWRYRCGSFVEDGTFYQEKHCRIRELTAENERLARENRILAKKNAHSLANNLCPDHRDKQQGKPCLACEIERLRKIVGSVVRSVDRLVHYNVEPGDDPHILRGPAWHKVSYVCCLGSTSAHELCREFGVDPEHEAKPDDEPDDGSWRWSD